jgi:hypothetical protein
VILKPIRVVHTRDAQRGIDALHDEPLAIPDVEYTSLRKGTRPQWITLPGDSERIIYNINGLVDSATHQAAPRAQTQVSWGVLPRSSHCRTPRGKRRLVHERRSSMGCDYALRPIRCRCACTLALRLG